MKNLKKFYALIVFFFYCFPSSLLGFELAENYSYQSEKWLAKKVPEGTAYICVPCENEIRLQITSGPFNEDITPDLFLSLSKSEEARLNFAKETLKSQIPKNLNPEIEILNSGYGPMFGIDVVGFSAVVEMGSMASWDTSYIGVFKNRIVKITINYMDGSLDEVARNALNEFLGTLRFKTN